MEKVKDNSLDEIVDSINLNEVTEMEGVANQIFKADTTRTKLTQDEIGLAFSTSIIFNALGMQTKDPTDKFMQLKKSHDGWSTEKFVQAAGGIQEQRQGGFLRNMKDAFFTPKK